jgi:hypothetical protein
MTRAFMNACRCGAAAIYADPAMPAKNHGMPLARSPCGITPAAGSALKLVAARMTPRKYGKRWTEFIAMAVAALPARAVDGEETRGTAR